MQMLIVDMPDANMSRSEDEGGLSLDERDRNEKLFFARGIYRELSKDMMGVGPLRHRLSDLLYEHLATTLPSLQKEVAAKLQVTSNELKILGPARASARQQRRFLMDVAHSFEKVAQAAIDGNYTDGFFSNVDASIHITKNPNTCRLRAAIQHANMQYAAQMRLHGSKFNITEASEAIKAIIGDESEPVKLESEYASAQTQQYDRDYDEAVEWVKDAIRRSRGCELAGNFNPLIIGALFREQSGP